MKRPPSGPRKSSARPVRGDARRVQELFGIARALSSNLFVDGLLKEIVRVAERLTGAEGASLLLLDEEGRNLYFRTATGEKGRIVQGQMVPLHQGLAGWVVSKGEAVLVNDVRHDPRFAKDVDRATGFSTKSVLAVPFLVDGRVIGVCEGLNKKAGHVTPTDKRALEELAGLAAVSIENARQAESQHNFFDNMIEILTAAIEATDPANVGHPARVAERACAIGKKMGMTEAERPDLYYGALLHDVGFLAVNHRELLEKATPQAQARTREQAHPLLGAELLKGVRLFKNVIPIIRHHHEAWDGTGHPDHMAGEAIPLGARIVALVEQLEELRLNGLSEKELAVLQAQLARNGSGTKFDPRVVEAYLSL
ncbi:MAG: GAF domain-containing protein [Elusimicrobia bacterium]|nr:GAF domain-containing protein [Elusimicrobiota bacterium]